SFLYSLSHSLFLLSLHDALPISRVLGFFALIILLLMAATSHDFWLSTLSPRIWKSIHMLVYVAYALVIMHVMLGAIQLEHDSTLDRKSTRLNSSHQIISYAVFCL